MTMRTPLRWALAILIAAAVAGIALVQIQRASGSHGTADGSPLPNLGGPWTLTDQTGATRTDRSFPGKVKVMFFGYRFCPDVCPTELQVITNTLGLLGPDAAAVQPLFISVDPQRDRPTDLADYTTLFDDRILGMTGTPAQIKTITDEFRVYFKRIENKGGGSDDYLIDHSAFVYLTDRDGKVVDVVPPGSTAAALADRIRAQLKS